jgi:cation transport regulator ChaB
MPYKQITQLPDNVKNNLPKHAEEIYKEAFNSAEEQYGEEDRAHRVASISSGPTYSSLRSWKRRPTARSTCPQERGSTTKEEGSTRVPAGTACRSGSCLWRSSSGTAPPSHTQTWPKAQVRSTGTH